MGYTSVNKLYKKITITGQFFLKMDLSAFAKETFSAKDWVNSILQQNEAQSNPESYASSIVSKLQLAIFEISASLENTSGTVVRDLPRLLRDIEVLQHEVVDFQKKLHDVEQKVSKVDKDTTKSLEYLVKLDTVKGKLKATSKALQEADNWTTLMTDIEELFESNNLVAISQRLESLRQSLDLLSHVNDYSDRLLQLDSLRNRLEALASPYLVSAISAGDTAKTANMVQVFGNMDRLEQLLHYYTKCRRGTILHQWKELSNNEETNTIQVMNSFYDLLLIDLQEQTKWYNSVFHHHSKNSSNILLSIHSQVLTSLDPNPLHDFDLLIKKSSPSQGLVLLGQLKSSCDRLAQGFEAHLNDSIITGHFQNSAKKWKEASTPLTRYRALYLESEVNERLDDVLVQLEKNGSRTFCLDWVMKESLQLNTDIQLCIFNILMNPIDEQMKSLGNAQWAAIINSGSGLTEDLPEFGLAPMEYITQIGQYLMMLPQHLEPFVLEENKGLRRALSEQTFPHGESELLANQSHSAADFLLSCVAKATATLLSDTILRISTVNAKMAKQLASDIDYLGNIFEDLGVVLPARLSEMTDLFRAAASSILSSDVTFFDSASRDKDVRLTASVRAMCKLSN